MILRESLLVPGETFDSVKLKATQERLRNIGYFKNVNVYAVRAEDDQILGENYRDIYIEVEEAPTGHASLLVLAQEMVFLVGLISPKVTSIIRDLNTSLRKALLLFGEVGSMRMLR